MTKFFLLLFIPIWLFGEVLWQESKNETSAILERSSSELNLRLQFPNGAQANITTDWLENDLSAFMVLSNKVKTSSENVEISYVLDPLFAGEILLRIPPISILKEKQVIAHYSIPPIALHIEDFPPAELLKAEPLVRIDSLNPIDISRENTLLFEKPLTAQEELTIFRNRTFPLNSLLQAFATLSLLPILWVILRKRIKLLPQSNKITLLKTLKDLEKSFSANELDPAMYLNLISKMREYIQEKYGINSPFLTTEEFLREATTQSGIDVKSRETIKAFLKESDRVKFKGKMPTLQDLDTSLKLVHKLITNL